MILQFRSNFKSVGYAANRIETESDQLPLLTFVYNNVK